MGTTSVCPDTWTEAKSARGSARYVGLHLLQDKRNGRFGQNFTLGFGCWKKCTSGPTILLVEQNELAALAIADCGYVLETVSGTLSGNNQKLINNPQVRSAYRGI